MRVSVLREPDLAGRERAIERDTLELIIRDHVFGEQCDLEVGANFVPKLVPAPGETVIVKRLPNSFAGTDLDAILRREGRTSLIPTGFMTHVCVEATARAALDHVYTRFVVADATATRDLKMPGGETLGADEVKRNALAAVADRLGWIIASERLIGR